MMQTEGPCLQPGDRVRLTQDEFDIGLVALVPDQTILAATKGSIGTVVSFDEYRASHEEVLRREGITGERLAAREGWFSLVKEAITAGRMYPIRFEMVMPPEQSVDLVGCAVGKIERISASSLEKLG